MATPTSLSQAITGSGMNQGDLVTLLQNMASEINDIQTTLASVKAIYDAHTHLSDGNAATVSLPDTDAATGTAGTASAITDSSGTNIVLTAG